jgi:hypothetical protein
LQGNNIPEIKSKNSFERRQKAHKNMYYSVYNLMHIEEKLSMLMLFYNNNIQR